MPPPWSISVGGIVVVCALILTMGLWIQYWGRDHNYHETAEGMSNSELWARTFGQIANMVRYLWAREQTHSSLIESQALLSVRYRVTVTRAHARWCHTRTHYFVYSLFCLLTFCRRSWPFSSSRCQRTRSLLRPLELHGSRSGMFAFSTLFFLFQLIYLDVFQATLSVCWMLVFRHIIKQTGGLDLCHRFK